MIADYRPSERKEEIYYKLCFDDGGHNGFGFNCDENGNLPEDMNPAAKENYAWCLEHPEKFARFNQVVLHRHTYKEPASGICKCGERIMLYAHYLGACECPHCGRWWNIFGQEVNPPSTWSDGDDW